MARTRTRIQGHGGYSSEAWVVYMEVTATLLIAFGAVLDMLSQYHYFSGGDVLQWFNTAFFGLQTPVYYVAFGYAYQHTWRVRDARSWLRSVGFQAILCLVPFLSITTAGWLVDIALGEAPLTWIGLFRSLFVSPSGAMAFYPIVLLMYILTPTLRSKNDAFILLGIALALKGVAVFVPTQGWPYVVSGLCDSWLWFCMGMAYCMIAHTHPHWFISRLVGTSQLAKIKPIRGNMIVLTVAWIGCWLLAMPLGLAHTLLGSAILSVLGVGWFMSLFATPFAAGRTSQLFTAAGKITIGVFLLHPICLNILFTWLRRPTVAATIASMGAAGTWLVFVLALLGAYAAPALILWVCNHVGKLGFLLKPAAYLPAVQQN